MKLFISKYSPNRYLAISRCLKLATLIVPLREKECILVEICPWAYYSSSAYVLFIIHGWAHITMLNGMLISSLALREAINCSELNTTPSLMKRLFTMAKAKAFWVSATKVAFYPPNGAIREKRKTAIAAKPLTGNWCFANIFSSTFFFFTLWSFIICGTISEKVIEKWVQCIETICSGIWCGLMKNATIFWFYFCRYYIHYCSVLVT